MIPCVSEVESIFLPAVSNKREKTEILLQLQFLAILKGFREAFSKDKEHFGNFLFQ